MTKLAKCISAVVAAGAVLMSLTMSASAEDKLYDAKCTVTCAKCGLVTTATLNVRHIGAFEVIFYEKNITYAASSAVYTFAHGVRIGQ